MHELFIKSKILLFFNYNNDQIEYCRP